MAEHLFKKGQSGNPAGRPKGSKNRVIYDSSAIATILNTMGCNPFKELAKLAMKAKLESVRCNAASELAQYVAPKLKSVEISNSDDTSVSLTINTRLIDSIEDDVVAGE
jgi:hypothetical protein